MALRELFALFEVKVEGKEEVVSADVAVTKAAESLGAFAAATHAVQAETQDGAKAQKAQNAELEKTEEVSRSAAEAFAEGAEKARAFAHGAIEVGRTGLEVAEVFLAIRSRAALMTKVLITAAASLVGLGFVNLTRTAWGFVEATTAAVDEIGKMSTALGVGAESMQRWGHLADTSGASSEDLRASFKSLANQINQVRNGAEGASKNFKELGLDGKALADMPLEDAMIEVTAALGGMDEQGKKLALTQALLSETAIKMLPGFKGSTEEMRAQLLAMDELAGVYSEEFIRAAEATNDELHFMRNQLSVLRAGIVMEFLPSFRGAVKWVSATTAKFREFLKETDLVSRWVRVGVISGLVRFSSLLAAHWGTLAKWAGRFVRFISPVLRVIARFAAWALVLDDIIVFLQGGDSALGAFLDKAFGVGTANDILEKFGILWDAATTGIRLASEVLGWLWDDFTGLLGDVEGGTSTFDNAFLGFGGAIKEAIDLAKELWGWVDRLLGVSEAIAGIGEAIFQADDERLNREAIARAQDEARAAQSPRAATSTTNRTTSVVDNSKTSLTFNGRQSPETVRAATTEAQKIRSNRGAQNALIRGAT